LKGTATDIHIHWLRHDCRELDVEMRSKPIRWPQTAQHFGIGCTSETANIINLVLDRQKKRGKKNEKKLSDVGQVNLRMYTTKDVEGTCGDTHKVGVDMHIYSLVFLDFFGKELFGANQFLFIAVSGNPTGPVM
jgi:hypothetical protein